MSIQSLSVHVESAKHFIFEASTKSMNRVRAGIQTCLEYLLKEPIDHNQWKKHITRPQGILDFPSAPYPIECDEGIVLIDKLWPALVLTPPLSQLLTAFTRSAKRMERLESIYRHDARLVGQRLDINRAICTHLSEQRENMLRIIDEFEQQGRTAECAYSDRDIKKVEAELDRFEDSRHKWIDENIRLRDELQRERQIAWIEPIELARALDPAIQAAGIAPSEKESWLCERRTFGALLHHIYKRRNTAGHPFARAFNEREWARDKNRNPAVPNANPELHDAHNEFDLCHWNRIVAQQDFDDREILLRDRWREFEAARRVANRVIPTEDEMNQFRLEEIARITRASRDADVAYRNSVRRLRALGESVHTCGSTHVSSVTSGGQSHTDEQLQYALEHAPMKVEPWRQNLEIAFDHNTIARRASVSRQYYVPDWSGSGSVAAMDSYSAVAGFIEAEERHAKRKRANEILMKTREESCFAKRRRRGSRADEGVVAKPEMFVPDTLRHGLLHNVGGNGSRKRQFLGGERRAEWPRDATPLIVRPRLTPTEISTATDQSVARQPPSDAHRP